MFQTEFVHFIQSFESPALTFIMKVITGMGYPEFFIVFLITVMTFFDFRKGFLLMQIIIITGALTEFLKISFALPRPCDVDSSVLLPGKDHANSSPFLNKGAATFWSLPPGEVINYFRNMKDISYGLPSGHTSSAAALWGSVIVLFQKRWIQITSAVLILLIPLSRIYLGRHFLGDILGGYLVGFCMLLIFYFLVYRKNILSGFLALSHWIIVSRIRNFLVIVYLLFFPFVIYYLVPGKFTETAGFLLGINIGFMIISFRGYPYYPKNPGKAVLRLFISSAVFLICGYFIHTALSTIFKTENLEFIFLRNSLIIIFGIVISHEIGIKLKLVELRKRAAVLSNDKEKKLQI